MNNNVVIKEKMKISVKKIWQIKDLGKMAESNWWWKDLICSHCHCTDETLQWIHGIYKFIKYMHKKGVGDNK